MWKGESNILDSVGGYNGSKGTGVTYVNAEAGKGFSFNGTSTANLDLGTFLNFSTNDFTVEFWIQTTTTDPSRRAELIGKRDICGHSKFFDIQLQTNGTICFNYDGYPGSYGPVGLGYIDLPSAASVNDGVFHHVACVRQGTNALIYIDGSLSATQNPSDAQIADISNTSHLYADAGGPCAGGSYAYFTGVLDEVSIYTNALSASDILAVAQDGTNGKCCWGPRITSQPVSPSGVFAGSSTSFSVSALASPAAAYQWRLNGSSISGATSSVYNITSAQLTDVGTYDVIVSNSCGTATSDRTAVLSALGPVFTVQPQSQTKQLGDLATFPTTVVGSPTIAYSWRKNGTAINDGATYTGTKTATLTIGNVAGANAGTYSLHVSNSVGATNSANATLYVPAQITVQPTSKTGFVNGSVTFSVTATGTTPLTYQWMTNGGNISGATAASYVVSSVNSNWQGYVYTVQVSNPYGPSVTSDGAAILSVKGTVLTDIATPLKTTNCLNDTRPLCVTGGGALGYPPTYQWKHGSTAISGATASCYTVNVTGSSAAGSYTCVVSDPFGSDTSSVASIVYFGTSPAITLNPQSQTAVVGNPTHFYANATGPALTYTWLKDGGTIATGVNNYYTITNTGTSDAGTYSFQVINYCGFTNSSNAVLTVTNSSNCASNLLTGLIAWWQFESNLLDFTTNYSSTNSGTGVSYSAAKSTAPFNSTAQPMPWPI